MRKARFCIDQEHVTQRITCQKTTFFSNGEVNIKTRLTFPFLPLKGSQCLRPRYISPWPLRIVREFPPFADEFGATLLCPGKSSLTHRAKLHTRESPSSVYNVTLCSGWLGIAREKGEALRDSRWFCFNKVSRRARPQILLVWANAFLR